MLKNNSQIGKLMKREIFSREFLKIVQIFFAFAGNVEVMGDEEIIFLPS